MSDIGRAWLTLVPLAVIAVGCDFPGRPKASDRPVPSDRVTNFDVLYSTRCAGCHGADGNLGPAPPLNDPLFLAIVPDAELLRVIREGRRVTPTQKTPMPGFCVRPVGRSSEGQAKAVAEGDESKMGPKQQGTLTDAQAEVLARGIKHRWKSAEIANETLPPYLVSGSAAHGNKEAGARVFARACADCHGTGGNGGDNGDAQGGAINDPAFLSLISDQALRRYVITGRPDLGMPPFNSADGRPDDFRPLTSDEINDLVALLADWRQGAATKSH